MTTPDIFARTPQVRETFVFPDPPLAAYINASSFRGPHSPIETLEFQRFGQLHTDGLP